MRHDNIHNLEAREVCKHVKVEPALLPIGNAETESNNQAVKARLYVSAIGVWSAMERTFLDGLVMQMNPSSYIDKSPEKLYNQHEQQKRAYRNALTIIESWKWRKDLSRLLFFQPLVGWDQNALDSTSDLLS